MANITDALADIAITRSLLLERVRNGLSSQVAGIYKSIIDGIDRDIRLADDIRLRNMNITIKELKQRLEPSLTPIYADLEELAIKEASYVTAATNLAVGVDVVSSIANESTLRNIANTSLVEGATIREWFTSLDQSMQTDLERAIKLGVSIGETNFDLSKRVNDVLNKGINNAESIARTAVATVSNQARQKVYEENDNVIKGYEHVSVLDSRTSFICAGRDGAVWDKNGNGLNEQGRQNAYRVPPLHFNCRSVLVPVLKTADQLEALGIEVPKTTRASIDGQVSSGLNFEKWINTKSPEFQKEYLGQGRYDLWKDKKITFSDLVSQQGNTLTIKELKDS